MTEQTNESNQKLKEFVSSLSAFISSVYILLFLIIGFWFNPLYREFIFSLILSGNLFERILLLNHVIINIIIFIISGLMSLVMACYTLDKIDKFLGYEG